MGCTPLDYLRYVESRQEEEEEKARSPSRAIYYLALTLTLHR